MRRCRWAPIPYSIPELPPPWQQAPRPVRSRSPGHGRAGPGTWRLIVAVSASDDTVPGNNVNASGATATTAPNVDYTIQSVGSTGGTTAGAALTGTLTIRNAGTHAGSQFVPWALYLSTDNTLNIGTDQLIATGSIAAPGLAAGASSSAIPFAGTWPAANVPKTWFLIASVGAGDDVNAGNNAGASGGVVVNPPNINYAPTPASNTGGTVAGGAMTGTFQIQNNGTVNGASSVTWTAYMSSNATLDVTDPGHRNGVHRFAQRGSEQRRARFRGHLARRNRHVVPDRQGRGGR